MAHIQTNLRNISLIQDHENVSLSSVCFIILWSEYFVPHASIHVLKSNLNAMGDSGD
jgi:hypothetical protein